MTTSQLLMTTSALVPCMGLCSCLCRAYDLPMRSLDARNIALTTSPPTPPLMQTGVTHYISTHCPTHADWCDNFHDPLCQGARVGHCVRPPLHRGPAPLQVQASSLFLLVLFSTARLTHTCTCVLVHTYKCNPTHRTSARACAHIRARTRTNALVLMHTRMHAHVAIVDRRCA